MNKAFINFTWKNEPSIATPLNATNLNKMNNGLDLVDDRVIALDISKANQSDLLQTIKTVTYNTTTGLFKFTYWNGSTLTVDLNIEKIPVSFSMSPAGVITMVTADGTTYSCDVSTLIKTYTFLASTDIRFDVTLDSSGNRSIRAYIMDGAVTAAKLNPDYLAQILVQVQNAIDAADAANASAVSASADALLSQSYAVGNSGIRSGENTDNSKYYKEQAALSATNAATSATNAATSETNAATSETNSQTFYNQVLQLFNNIDSEIANILANAYAGASTEAYVDLTDGHLYYQSGAFNLIVDEDSTSSTMGHLLWEVKA